MTTYTYDAFYFEFDDDDAVEEFRLTEVALVTAPNLGFLTYTYGAPANEDGLLPIVPTAPEDIYTLLIEGRGDLDEAVYFAEVTWGAGNATTVMLIEGTSGNYVVRLAGDPIPATNAAEFAAFNDMINGVSNVQSGPYAPNTPIDLTQIPTASVTQDDLIIGFDENESLNGGIGDDVILAGPGDDTINPGAGTDTVQAGPGNDTVILSPQSNPADFFILNHDDLSGSIGVEIDAIANTGFVDKYGLGFTTLVDVADAVSGDGMRVDGTDFGDTFVVQLDEDDFLAVRPGLGDDTITVENGNLGYVRLDYRNSPDPINVDLGANTVSYTVFTDSIVGQVNEIRGSYGDDTYLGGAGDDVYTPFAGSDDIDGAGGFDLVRYDRNGVSNLEVNLATGVATGNWEGQSFVQSLSDIEYIRGTRDGTDRLTGSGADERLRTYAGNDTIDGGGGNDTIEDFGGTDTAIIGTTLAQISKLEIDANGALVIFSDLGISSYFGIERFQIDGTTYTQQQLIDAVGVTEPGPSDTPTDGDDDLTGDDTGEEINALGGDDTITPAGGNDTVDGGPGNDTAVLGIDLDDIISAVQGANGDITVVSSEGTDVFTSVEFFEFNGTVVTPTALLADGPISTEESPGDDLITGGDGPDRIDGGEGNDTINGGDGDDGLKGRDGDDLLVGGPGNDRLPGEGGNDTIIGNDGNDRLGGGDDNDLMIGGNGNDGGGAGPGNDTVYGGDGDDVFNGGYGRDFIDLGDGDDRSGASFGNDTMYGGAGNDLLTGGNGNDEIYGGAGDDTITSGLGEDTVNGGEGADLFIFNSLFGGGTTVIEDFEDGTDIIRVTGLRNPADPVGRLDITNITYDGQQAVEMTYGDHTIIVLDARESDFSEADFLFT
ncbi:calcium-binding protein [Thalassococcus sp. BH17M4-6]|uniref:calcium-binding protein n=1 Tax=Thalassococcus sp. BH17M4-6 TaxID=3413148 RepID=UPI003BDF4E6E